jgi:3-isopropylmalate dehydrogenase
MTKYNIAIIPGDGIGPEVITEAKKALNTIANLFSISINTNDFPFGAEYYLKNKIALPKGAFDDLGAHDALLLGAIGDPRIPMGPLEQDLLLALRFHFDLFMNLRPSKSFPKVVSPIMLPENTPLNILIVRENTEDFYMNLGGKTEKGNPVKENISLSRRLYKGYGELTFNFDTDVTTAYSLGILSEPGIRRIAVKAFTFAKERGNTFIHSATKSNALPHIYGFWDQVVAEVGKTHFPEIEIRRMNVDNLAYQLVRSPQNFSVILCPNLFGDIISDLTAGLIGGLGLAPSANIGEGLSMFEPVHGSAPDIAGKGLANPLAAILSISLLLSHLGEKNAAKTLDKAVYNYLLESPTLSFPFELGGKSTTSQVGDLVVDFIKKSKIS